MALCLSVHSFSQIKPTGHAGEGQVSVQPLCGILVLAGVAYENHRNLLVRADRSALASLIVEPAVRDHCVLADLPVGS
jgi:hypothetical protein